MIKGTRSERLLTLGDGVSMMRQDLDVIEARASQGVRATGPRLARIEAPVGTDFNTFNVTFLDGEYTASAGTQTPTYDDRSPGFAHNIGDAEMNVGDIVVAFPWSNQWWFRRGVSQPQPPIVVTGVWGNWEPSGTSFGLGVGTPIPSNIPCSFGRFALSSNDTSPARVSGFLRFTGITIPQGATINSATITIDEIGHNNLNLVDADSYGLGTPGSSGSARCDIYCEDNDNATALSTASQADGLPRTTANVLSYDHSYGEYNAGDAVVLPDLTALVQEVVNRPGWAGDGIQFLFDEDGSSSFNASGGGSSYGILATVNDSAPGPPTPIYESPRLEISFN